VGGGEAAPAAQPLAAGGQSDRKRNFLEPENIKMVWERFATAIKPVGPTAIIGVASSPASSPQGLHPGGKTTPTRH